MKQWELHGYVTPSMILLCVFQFLYIADGLWFEVSYLCICLLSEYIMCNLLCVRESI